VFTLVCTGAAAAAPDDAYLRGQQAYQRGDVVAAMTALREAARAGHAPAMSMLAFILDRADFSDEATRWYREAAAHGDAEGHAGLADLYLSGRGVAKDEKAAFAHFSQAADLGHALAIEVVASAFLGGSLARVAPADEPAALAAVTRAALNNHLPSIDALAAAYRSGGRFGVGANAEQAAAWQARAVELRRLRAVAAPRPAR